jgi:hypothetical protein
VKAEFDYIDLGGGVNRGISPDRIPSRQAAELINFYPYGTHLKRRPGYKKVASTAAFEAAAGDIMGMWAYVPGLGSWDLLVGGDTQFAVLKSTGLSILPISGETQVPAGGAPYLWSTVQYKKYSYWLRKGLGGRFYRVSASLAARAGIAAPTVAATIAAGAAGTLTAGNYRAVYTFYNAATASESNPAPVSNTLALGANLKINYTGIAVSTDPFVTSRRIYRTIPDQVGVYFFVAEIADNLTTTYTGDNVAVADLGRPVSFNNGVPPDDLYVGAIWNERLFASDGDDVWFSEFLLPECFGAESSISVFPDDGHKITAVCAFGDRLIIAKTNAIYYLTGTDARNFALATLTDRHGCASQASMKVAEGNLFWVGMDKAVYKSDGTSVKKISDPEVTPYMVAFGEADLPLICAAVVAEKNWYIVSLGSTNPTGSYTLGDVLVHDYRENAWTLFQLSLTGAFAFLTDFFDSVGAHKLYGVARSTLYDMADEANNYDDVDGQQSITVIASWLSKADDFGLPGRRKALRSVGYLADYTRLPWGSVDDSYDSCRVQVFGEGDTSSAVLDRGLSMDGGGGQHRLIGVGLIEKPQTRFQAKLTFSTTFQIVLKEVKFITSVFKRLTGQPQ